MRWLEQRAGGPWKLAGWLLVASIVIGGAGELLTNYGVSTMAAIAVSIVVALLFMLQIVLMTMRKLEQWAGGPWKLAGWLFVASFWSVPSFPREWMVANFFSLLGFVQFARLPRRKRAAQWAKHLGVRQWVHFAYRQVQGWRAGAMKLAAVVLVYVSLVLVHLPSVVAGPASIAIMLVVWRIFPVNDNIIGQVHLTYTGERNSDGKPHGHGTMTFADGTTYTGEFKDDKFNGQGTYTFADGTTYVGNFEDGLPVP